MWDYSHVGYFEIMTLNYPLFGTVFIIRIISFCFLCNYIGIVCILHVTEKSVSFKFVFYRVIRIKINYSVGKGRFFIYQITSLFLVIFRSQKFFCFRSPCVD